eukprot:CAMPEP_0114533128 /NCGR_PEP_ID=MMETSP0109-20121206/27065_1 /TAXON_ID=29199 /ORGANISM="Chlorarachnion reptans, Strain CCCM449" /LENGTH=291 /DNA_ID=CAMNT_0001716301 /DNA_START=259 /DNA_END=1136 /DNA_ORIENTATION=-
MQHQSTDKIDEDAKTVYLGKDSWERSHCEGDNISVERGIPESLPDCPLHNVNRSIEYQRVAHDQFQNHGHLRQDDKPFRRCRVACEVHYNVAARVLSQEHVDESAVENIQDGYRGARPHNDIRPQRSVSHFPLDRENIYVDAEEKGDRSETLEVCRGIERRVCSELVELKVDRRVPHYAENVKVTATIPNPLKYLRNRIEFIMVIDTAKHKVRSRYQSCGILGYNECAVDATKLRYTAQQPSRQNMVTKYTNIAPYRLFFTCCMSIIVHPVSSAAPMIVKNPPIKPMLRKA